MHYWHGNAKTSRTGLCSRSIRLHCHLELSDPLRWPHRHEAFGPGLRLRRGRRTNGSRRLARPGAHRGAGDRCRGEPGGALSGSTERHPIASPPPEPIGSAMSYDADVSRVRRLMPLVKEGFASSLTEAATRFAISHPSIGTILAGMATPQQFEDALITVQKGPLPANALERLATLWQAFAGEPR